jgi:hypothetical protein
MTPKCIFFTIKLAKHYASLAKQIGSKALLYVLCKTFAVKDAQAETLLQQTDSVEMAYYAKKNGWEVALQSLSLNIGVWGFNRFVTNTDYARIDIHTIKKNLSHPFVWDNDRMATNMFLHPYHGSLYFNSARSQGFSYWQSGIFAFGGSAMWELFMENEYPSLNDIIATPVGGMALGEVFFRMSDWVLDNRQTGWRRFGGELAGFLIAPTRSLTRLLNGEAWRRRTTTGRQFGLPDVSVEVSAGVRALALRGAAFDRGMVGAIGIAVEYGERFSGENERPYDYFTLNSSLNIPTSQPLLGQLNIAGRWYVADLVDTQKDFFSIGIYQHFDYYDSNAIADSSTQIPYKLATPASLGAGFVYQSKRSKIIAFDAFLHANTVLLGGALSDYYKVGKRSYNLASGFSAKAGFRIAYKGKIILSGSYEQYRMFTWDGYPQDVDWSDVDEREFSYQGDPSAAVLGVASLRIDAKLREHLFLTYTHYAYSRNTKYKCFDDVQSQTMEGRILVVYKF